MRFTTSSILALALSIPAQACVQISLIYDVGTDLVSGSFIDNNDVSCSIIDYNYGLLSDPHPANGEFGMICPAGHTLTVNLLNGNVRWRYGTFDGTFQMVVAPGGAFYRYDGHAWGC